MVFTKIDDNVQTAFNVRYESYLYFFLRLIHLNSQLLPNLQIQFGYKITANHVQGGLKIVTDIILFILIHALYLSLSLSFRSPLFRLYYLLNSFRHCIWPLTYAVISSNRYKYRTGSTDSTTFSTHDVYAVVFSCVQHHALALHALPQFTWAHDLNKCDRRRKNGEK